MLLFFAALPVAVLLRKRRRVHVAAKRVTLHDPRAIAGRACCGGCATAQRLGEMPVGDTCKPCDLAHRALACDPLPWREAAVDNAIRVGLEAGLSPDHLVAWVAGRVYPVTSVGHSIDWRAIVRSSHGTPKTFLGALAHRIRARVDWSIACGFEAEADSAWTRAGYPRSNV